MNQHVFGFQRRISVVTIGISVISLLISMLALGVTAASYFSGYRSKFVPLTEKQFNAEKDAGFSLDQIIKFQLVQKSN